MSDLSKDLVDAVGEAIGDSGHAAQAGAAAALETLADAVEEHMCADVRMYGEELRELAAQFRSLP